MSEQVGKIIRVSFYRTESENEPVRDWMKKLSKQDRVSIGEDIKTVEFGWPLSMPLIKRLEQGLWEVRTNLKGNRQARVIFTVEDGQMILLHAFFKDSQKTQKEELDTARKQLSRLVSTQG